jgi:hypothetical protein
MQAISSWMTGAGSENKQPNGRDRETSHSNRGMPGAFDSNSKHIPTSFFLNGVTHTVM